MKQTGHYFLERHIVDEIFKCNILTWWHKSKQQISQHLSKLNQDHLYV